MPKKRVLFLASDPSDEARLRLGAEHREIAEALLRSRQRDLKLDERFAVRATDVSQALHDLRPQIVHFSGHGTSAGDICFEDAFGLSRPISQSALASLFSIANKDVECVVLNACYSELQANEISKHVRYVIAMNDTISDDAAIGFAAGLYKALAAGRTYEDAFAYGLAELGLLGLGDSDTPSLIQRSAQRKTDDHTRDFVEIELASGISMEVDPLETSAPIRGLVRDPYRGWYERSASALVSPGFTGIPDHISICLDPPPSDVPRDKRDRRETLVALNPTAFSSLQELLDDLYVNYLRGRFPPASYGQDWVLWGKHPLQSDRLRGINPERVILPWSWLANKTIPPESRGWAESPLDSFGISAGTLLRLGRLADEQSTLDPTHPSWAADSSRHYVEDKIVAGDIFGLQVNSEELLRYVLAGPGKQPVAALSDGLLQRIRVAAASSTTNPAFRELLIDTWMGQPAGGHILTQTDKTLPMIRRR